jgi:hypothetical protein
MAKTTSAGLLIVLMASSPSALASNDQRPNRHTAQKKGGAKAPQSESAGKPALSETIS